MDVYKRLRRSVNALQRDGTPAAIAAVVDPAMSRRALHRVLRDAEVRVDTVLSVSHAETDVHGVPTVVAVGRGGEPPLAWIGLQDASGERAILSHVQSWADAREPGG